MTTTYPTDGQFFAAPYAFDETGVGPCLTDDGRPLYGVFSYDNGPDDGVYCFGSGPRSQCQRYALDFNRKTARGEHVVVTPVLRYF